MTLDTIIWIVGVGLPIAALIYLFGWLVGFNVSCQMTNWGTGFDDGWKAHEELTVVAVPLDKLCEFLEKCGADSYCGTCKQIMGGCFTDGNGCGSEHFWKELLTKWMEENK